MSCTKQTVQAPKQDDTKRSEGWLGPGSETSRENKLGGADRRGTFIHLQPSVIIQDLAWALGEIHVVMSRKEFCVEQQ